MLKKLSYLYFLIIFSLQFMFPNATLSQALETQANFDFENKLYANALNNYLKLYEEDTLNWKYNLRIGQCYLQMNVDRSEAISYLEFAATQEITHPEVFFYLAESYYYKYNFLAAAEQFLYYLEQKKIKRKDEATHYLSICKDAAQLINAPVNVKIVPLDDNINTEYAEYNPFVPDDESFIVFTTNRDDGFNNVYSSTMREGFFRTGWRNARAESKLDARYDVIAAGLSSDGNVLFVHSNNYSPIKDIDVSYRDSKRFKVLRNVGSNINTKYTEEGACITQNGDTLFFASNKPGGYGGLDLYMSLKLPNGKWGLPSNLGSEINTEYDENYPIYTDSLLFCSKGHENMGGYDIFISKLNRETEQWSKPRNIGYPINNVYDNTNISLLAKRYGYMSAIHKDGHGDLDICKVIFKDDPLFVVYTFEIRVGDSIKWFPLRDIEIQDLDITVYKASGDLYGIYNNYNRETGRFLVSFKPGEYKLDIKINNEAKVYDISIPEAIPANNKVEKPIYIINRQE